MSEVPDEYNELLLRCHSYRNRFPFCRYYVTTGLLTREEALFIQDLINLAAMKKVKKRSFNVETKETRTYFLCMVKFLRKTLLWEAKTQTRLFHRLERKNYLQVRRIGVPPRRHVWINIRKLEQDVVTVLKEKSLFQNPRTPTREGLKDSRVGAQ